MNKQRRLLLLIRDLHRKVETTIQLGVCRE